MIAVQDPDSNTEVANSIGAAAGAVLLGESPLPGWPATPSATTGNRTGSARIRRNRPCSHGTTLSGPSGLPLACLSSCYVRRLAWTRGKPGDDSCSRWSLPSARSSPGSCEDSVWMRSWTDGASCVRLGVQIQELQAAYRGRRSRGAGRGAVRIQLMSRDSRSGPLARVPGRERSCPTTQGPVGRGRLRGGADGVHTVRRAVDRGGRLLRPVSLLVSHAGSARAAGRGGPGGLPHAASERRVDRCGSHCGSATGDFPITGLLFRHLQSRGYSPRKTVRY